MSEDAVTEIDVEVRDYLVPLSTAERARRYRKCKQASKTSTRCAHPNLKSFTFADVTTKDGTTIPGQTIKMCSDCTEFDGDRQLVLSGKRHPTSTHHTTGLDRYINVTDYRVDVYLKNLVVVASVPKPINQFYMKLMERVTNGCHLYNKSKTVGIAPKRKGTLHNIGGRWCKCNECRVVRNQEALP
jgi:hypothetical protein